MKTSELRRAARRIPGAWKCALLCALCAFASFVPFLFQDGGFFHVWSDFNWQQVPFGMALHNSLAAGGLGGWCWNVELGMSTIQAFSFYALGSPFYWISLIFPAGWYPYLVGWIYILKYTAAGVTAYHFIRRFTKTDLAAVTGAVMYAFSGFQATNLMFYHFHDAVALFPLLLLGLEKILEDPKNRGTFVFAVFINALCNYYFFVLEAVFTAGYFLFRSLCQRKKRYRQVAKDLGNTVLCAVWGMAMAAVLLLPNVLYVLGSPRARPSLLLGDIVGDSRRLLFSIRSFLLPGDTMAWQSAFYVDEFNSVAAWLPMAGLGLCLAYVWKHKWRSGDWLSRMIPVLLVIALSPLLSSGFLLFSEYTGRWLFMAVLMFALASAKVLEDPDEYPVRRSLRLYFAAALLFCAAVYLRPYDNQTPSVVFFPERFLLCSGIALAGILGLVILRRVRRIRSVITLALVCVFAAGSTFMTLATYRSFTGDGTDPLNVKIGAQLETNDPQYRYTTDNPQLMLPGGASGMITFSSTVSQGTRAFDALFGFYSNNRSMNKNTVRGLQELFAAKYNVRSEAGVHTPVQTVEADGQTRVVLELDVCPIGFAADRYILKEDLLAVEAENRGAALLYAAVIDPEDEEKVSGICAKATGADLPLADSLEGVVAKNRENAVSEFTRDAHGFTCVSDYESDRMVYFSVPDEGGWTAVIDGEKQEILNSAGMMLLRVPAGHHEIEFHYVTPGYTAGLIVSIAAIAGFIGWTVFRKVRSRPHA